jgi:hypothetical protein
MEMDWTYGSIRTDIDSLWKSMLANSGLVDRSSGRVAGDPAPGPETGDKRPAEEDKEARKEPKVA